MGENTKIQWAHHTFSTHWGCVKVSPACKNCYAERDSKRFGYDVWGPDKPRKFQSDKYWNEPLKWDQKAKAQGIKTRVFSASMSDVFEDRRDLDSSRERLWSLIEKTPNLIWMLLTKRPESWHLLPERWKTNGCPETVWLGVTAENQEWFDRRITYLAQAPAKIRFISAEPLLGPITLGQYAKDIQWLIAGGESGSHIRNMEMDWVRSLRDQALANNIKFFYKQAYLNGEVVGTPELDGRRWTEVPAY